jgi:hypothetical protein
LRHGRGRDLINYDPDRGLKTIAVAGGAIKHTRGAWRETNDPFLRRQLEDIIDRKIDEQVAYLLYRDSVVVPSQKAGSTGVKGRSRIAKLKSDLPAADPGDVVASRWRKRFFAKRGVPDPEKIARAKRDAKDRCIGICEQETDGALGGFTGDFERYTPAPLVEAVRKVLSRIDLDPASCEEAQRTVKASRFFTKEKDGLKQPWHGRVFLNPPFDRDLCPKFIGKLLRELKHGHVAAAIALTNNCADTDWFNRAVVDAAGVCLVHKRIKFVNGTWPQGPQGQTFFYFGDDIRLFENVFRTIGNCFRLSAPFKSTLKNWNS